MNFSAPLSLRFDPDRLSRVAHWMDRYVTERKFAGCSVLVKQNGEEVLFNATGQRDTKANLPFERDTLARIYSMTKPITSVAIMMLVEKGLFHLDAPISDFIPEFADCRALVVDANRLDQTEPAPTPTLHHLLTHTSGFTYPFNPGVLPGAMEELGLIFKPDQGRLEDVVKTLATLPLAFQPGSKWEYSVSTDVLGRIVEVVSGKSLDAFFQEEIFAPLGMSDTGFTLQVEDKKRFASLYTPLSGDAMALGSAKDGGETLRLVDHSETTSYASTQTFSGGGGLIATIDDYMQFCEMIRSGGVLHGNRLLSSQSVAFMMRNHLPGDIASMGPQSFAEQPMEGMGFGLAGAVVLDPARARTPGSVGDFSWGGIASTFFWIDPVLDMSVVFLTQLSPSSSYPARPELKALIHGALIS